jgi:hypothetical protein
MIMGSGPRLRTCMELVDHGVDAAGHAPATTDESDHCDHRGSFLAPRLDPGELFDPWRPASSYVDLEPFTEAFAEVREA